MRANHRRSAPPNTRIPEAASDETTNVVLVEPQFDLNAEIFGSREGWNQSARDNVVSQVENILSERGITLLPHESSAVPADMRPNENDSGSQKDDPCSGTGRSSVECATYIRTRYGSDYILLLDVGGEYATAASSALHVAAVPAVIYGSMLVAIGVVLTTPIWLPIALLSDDESEDEDNDIQESEVEEVIENEVIEPQIAEGAHVALIDSRSADIVWTNQIGATDWRDEDLARYSVQALFSTFPLGSEAHVAGSNNGID